MHNPVLSCLLPTMLLAGCAVSDHKRTAPYQVEQAALDETLFEPCDDQLVQYALGQKADAEMAARLKNEAHARILRWLPPRSAATADYRPDRINIEYNDAYIVTGIRCG